MQAAMALNAQGHLTIGGCDALDLAHQYQTPLVVYDVTKIRHQVQQFQQAFQQAGVSATISYASKAFAVKAIYQVMQQEQVHVDVVSLGEMMTALQAGFPAAQISFHGNNKSLAELNYALQKHIGVIIVDNFDELNMLTRLLHESYPQQKVAIMLRITPGISAHTHEYDQTGQIDSKFGFDVQSQQAQDALQQALAEPQLQVIGLHAHIGSQIMAVEGFELLVKKLCQLVASWYRKFQFVPQVLNLGGGFGIRYVASDEDLAPKQFVQAIVQTLKQAWPLASKLLPAIWVEPGRSLVGAAGVSLYSIGTHKKVPGICNFVTVDGGMGDNIRPALYQADYTAVLAKAPQAKPTQTVTIAGRYCESGDILVKNQALPPTNPGDILAILDTGAYGYSMASNYNRVARPAVVFAEHGQSQVVVKRETPTDLLRLDQDYQVTGEE